MHWQWLVDMTIHVQVFYRWLTRIGKESSKDDSDCATVPTTSIDLLGDMRSLLIWVQCGLYNSYRHRCQASPVISHLAYAQVSCMIMQVDSAWRMLFLGLPCFIYGLRTIYLSLLYNRHVSPFRHIGSIHVSAGLHTETSIFAPSRKSIDGEDINVVTRIELESWLSAIHLKMKVRVLVTEFCK